MASPDEQKGLNFLQKNAFALDLNRTVSFGKGGAKNYIDLGSAKAEKFGFEITNDTTETKILILGATTSIYRSATRLKKEVGGTPDAIILTDGRLATETGLTGLVVRPKGTNRLLADFVNSLDTDPTTLLALKFESSVFGTRAAESTNFNQTIRSVYISPYRNPQDVVEQDLRDYRNDGVVAAQYLNVPFFKEGKNILLSHQNYLVFSIAPKTILSVSQELGGTMSNTQSLYRQNNAAATALAPLRIGSDCGC